MATAVEHDTAIIAACRGGSVVKVVEMIRSRGKKGGAGGGGQGRSCSSVVRAIVESTLERTNEP